MSDPNLRATPSQYTAWFRSTLPYINAHRGRTFVVMFGGEVIEDPGFANLVHDLALLSSLGVRLVLVHGARPRIERLLRQREVEMRYVDGLRVTDAVALECVKEATGAVRLQVEALLSMGLANSPMAGARIRVSSGNLVTARPLGIRDGVDFQHTGEVRRIDHEGICHGLDNGDLVLLSPLGFSPTGEVFNLSAEGVATAAAVSLQADKLICLLPGEGLDISEMVVAEAQALLQADNSLGEQTRNALSAAVEACNGGVKRAHLVSFGEHGDSGLLLELFTRDGSGTLVATDPFEDLRAATIDDVGGILELIRPLEDDGILVRRSRERLETEVRRFVVIERDNTAIATAALYPFPGDKLGELACVVVHPDYRRGHHGDDLLAYIEQQARKQGLEQLFVLTTRTAHWFKERGFEAGSVDALPMERRCLYNLQRNSQVLIKRLSVGQ
jgi:amino-acid N-acetyltransferase